MIAVTTTADLASAAGLYVSEQHCTKEKTAYLLAQIDAAPRDQRAATASNVDLVCGIEAVLDSGLVRIYREAAGRADGAQSGWDDPTDPSNQDPKR